MAKKDSKSKKECITRYATINLHKRLYSVSHTRKALRAVKAIREFAKKSMGTEEVKIDVDLNRYIWERGMRHVPTRVRVKMSRKRNDDSESAHEFYTVVSHMNVPSFKGLINETIKDE